MLRYEAAWESHGSMMLILELSDRDHIGEPWRLRRAWAPGNLAEGKDVSNQGDTSLLMLFMTTALTICGQSYGGGRSRTGWPDSDTDLLAKAILDMANVLVLTIRKAGAIFVGSTRDPSGLITLLAHLIAPIMTPQALRIFVPSWL